MQRFTIGVVGPGEEASDRAVRDAFEMGEAAARAGWAILTGGRPVGVMDAASRGARCVGGLTIGILPGSDRSDVSDAVEIAVLTGMGEARDAIVALSSHALVVCGMNPGTAAEVAFGLKAGKPVVLIEAEPETVAFFRRTGANEVIEVASAAEALERLRGLNLGQTA